MLPYAKSWPRSQGIVAVEINISCPNVKQGGMAFGTTCSGAAEVTRAVRRAYPGTLIVKLSPNVTDITEIARAVEAEGADAVSLINTLLGMAIDVERMRPCPVYSYRRAIGAGRKARRSQDGMAGGKSRQHSGNRSWRHYERQGCSNSLWLEQQP